MPPIQRSGPPLVPLARLPSVLPTNFADARLEKNDGVACITIDRPDVRKAFRARTVVPADRLRTEFEPWCREILSLSPTALKLAKQSFNADTDHIHGITEMGFRALELYYRPPEAAEGRQAFLEKRQPDLRTARRRGWQRGPSN